MATDPDTMTADAAEPIVTSNPNHTPPAPDNAAEAFYNETDKPENDPNAGQANGEVEGGENTEGQVEPIGRPKSWSNEQEETWNALPRNVQEVIANRENERDRFVSVKAQEAARTRQAAETEFRGHIQTLLTNHAQQIDLFARQMGMPDPPDQRLLQSDDPEHFRLYNMQQARYTAATAQFREVQQAAETARQNAQALQSQAQQAAIQEDEARLAEKWPGWSEPSERAKILARLAPIAAEFGYGTEAQAEANATDLFALDIAAGWKADAEKYRALMKQKMAPVRAAKQVPPAQRAASPMNGANQPVDASALLYPDDQPRR